MIFCILCSGNSAFEIGTCFCDSGFASRKRSRKRRNEVTKYDGLTCPMTIYTYIYIYIFPNIWIRVILKGFKQLLKSKSFCHISN